MGRQNSKKLLLEKEMEKDNDRKLSTGTEKPRRSSIVGDEHRGSAGVIVPI